MKFRYTACCAATTLTLCLMMNSRPAHAATPGNTGQCNDGTYSQSAEKKGACRGHKGVKEWYSEAGASQPSGKAAKASQPAQSPSAGASAAVPSGAKGQCNDDSYSFDAMKKGACRGHKGVKAWFAADAPSPAPAKSSAAPMSASAAVPAGAKGQCNDDSYSFDAMKKGACRGHKGVKAWFAADSPAPAPVASSPAPSPAPKQSAATPAPAPSYNQTKSSAPAPTMQQRPGGGAGQVWVNTSTKVYHCMGDRYYGKTKEGAYMSESDAKAKGVRADAGKPCSK